MLEIIGIVGAVCFALCGIPQVYKCYKDKSAQDISWAFLYLWAMGAVCSFVYAASMQSYALMLNFGCSVICSAIISVYKIREGEYVGQ